MIYDWYKVINLTEFLALNIPSRELTLNLVDLGPKDILITYGVGLGILYEDCFLAVNLNDYNPFEFHDIDTEGNSLGYYACYIDESSQDVYLGVNGRDEE
jgi:hypothetical protein